MVALSLMLALVFMLMTPLMAQEATEEPTTDDGDTPAAEVTAEATVEATEEPAATATTPTTSETGTYTVQPGDNLFQIARRFNTTVQTLAALNGIANPRLIFVGQVLQVPGGSQPPTVPTIAPPIPTATPVTPPTAGTYTVQPGDTLFKIATRFNTTVAELAALNNISNRNFVFVGQVLQIPGGTVVQPTSTEVVEMEDETTVDTTQPEDTTETTDVTMATDPGYDVGIILFYGNQDPAQAAAVVDQLSMNWVKLPVDWSALEPTQGAIDLSTLTNTVNALDTQGLNIMLTVSNAPPWARNVTGDIIENGPPQDLATFETFMSTLANEYAGTVDAYQIWEEPNLRRNWRCQGADGRPAMCDLDYLELVRAASKAVTAADAQALLVSAGLAPTRFNDRINAIDDRLFLQTLVANDINEMVDAIGAHPGGFANPPDAVCCEAAAGVETHFEDPSFYFRENLQGYRQILVDGGAGDLPLWVTRFGWGSSADTDPPSEINIYVSYISLGEQAIFVPRAFELGEELGYVGVMFLDNLNGCAANATRAEVCYTSLIGPGGQPRPVFDAVASLNAGGADADAVDMEAEATAEAEATTESSP
jgi:LysM repeat protein